MDLLEVRDLHASYDGAVRALAGVSLSVPEGAVMAVLGNNGAGKSTLLRAISGTLGHRRGAITDGTVEFEGAACSGSTRRRSRGAGSSRSPKGGRSSGT